MPPAVALCLCSACVEHVVNERGFAGAAETPVIATSMPSGIIDVDVLQVVCAGAANVRSFRVGLAPELGTGISQLAGR